MKAAIVIDTETTGLVLPDCVDLNRQPKIIEFGAIKIIDGKQVDSFESLINPGGPLSEEIIKITGLTDVELVNAPCFEVLLPALKEFFIGADFLIAHNAEFDVAMLRFDLQRAGCEDFPWPEEIICSMNEYRHVFNKWPRLTQLYEHFTGEKLAQTHRALDDVRALCKALDAANFWPALQ